MAIRDFRELLANREEKELKVCVGLDPTRERMSEISRRVNPRRDDILGFNRAIIDATHDLVIAFKMDLAFYAQMGVEGFLGLEQTAAFIRAVAPEVFIILDGKFGGAIAIANEGWAKYAFDEVGADAVTIQSFPGADALQPFLSRADKCIFVLCHTSGRGAHEFQDLPVLPIDTDGRHMPLFKYIATRVANNWNKSGNCGLVVNAIPSGKTWTEELIQVRKIAPDLPILIPGLGAQDGDLERTVKASVNNPGKGAFILSASRSIIYASRRPDFAEAARAATQKLHDQIHAALAATKEA